MFWRRTIASKHLAISDRGGRWRVYADDQPIYAARSTGAAGAEECRAWIRAMLSPAGSP